MSLCSQTQQKAPALASDEDFENCKGQCGYTPWCRACMEERKKMIDEVERKEADHVDDQYT